MAKNTARRNWGDLITTLSEHKNHFESANKILRGNIDDFCAELKREDVAHANLNTNGTAWGSKSLMKCFIDIFDPTLQKIFPPKSLTNELLLANDVTLPLATFVIKKESYQEYGKLIKKTVRELERYLPSLETPIHNNPSISEEKLYEDGESLELLASIFEAMFEALDVHDEIRWCSICFRRVHSNVNNCTLHRSTKDDTNYRIGTRIKAKIPESRSEAIEKNRAKRKALGEKFSLISDVSDVPKAMPHQTNSIIVSKQIYDLVINTQDKDWNIASCEWGSILELLPNVQKKFSRAAKDSQNWKEFTRALTDSLNNEIEDTEHPYWFFLMLVEADNWLHYEMASTDGRLTDTKYEILKYISQGLSNAEIAKKVNKSRPYVGQIKALFT